MVVDDRFGDTETQTDTAFFHELMARRIERLKQVLKLVRWDRFTRIFENKANESGVQFDLSRNLRLGRAVFDRIVQQVDEQLAQPVRLSVYIQMLIRLADDALLITLGTEGHGIANVVQNLTRIHLFEFTVVRSSANGLKSGQK